ncbi:MAG: hypothetical protein KDD63_21165 [Bacteroidetes bacterium]|nr:hypothetical protein [Bacteroidota bacterium]MCB0845759.1 hypothetical protein [Bacteroidota bacterium]MCB0854752.1 hypothetical protein [Bacteroidota bacterium]
MYHLKQPTTNRWQYSASVLLLLCMIISLNSCVKETDFPVPDLAETKMPQLNQFSVFPAVDTFTMTGTVRDYSYMFICGFTIHGDDGKKYDPFLVNNELFIWKDYQRVRFTYTKKPIQISSCEMGILIDVHALEVISQGLNPPGPDKMPLNNPN